MNGTAAAGEPGNPSPDLPMTEAMPSELISPTKANKVDAMLKIHEDGEPDFDLKRQRTSNEHIETLMAASDVGGR